MSSFSATASKKGIAETSTDPKYIVTSSASATATSDVSQSDAQKTADTIAEEVAKSVAGNDANIISQTLALSPAGIIGAYSYLNIEYAVQTDISSSSEPNTSFTGVIYNTGAEGKNSLILNYEKLLYNIDIFPPTVIPTTRIQNATLTGFYSLTYKNNSNNTATLTGQRTSYKYIPYSNGYIYNVVVCVNVIIEYKGTISTSTTYEDFNKNITKVTIVNKMAQGVSTYTPNGTFDKFSGVQLKEAYSPDGKWNYISTNFDKASISGSSSNVTYPYTVQSLV
jgi:hypothetical protein